MYGRFLVLTSQKNLAVKKLLKFQITVKRLRCSTNPRCNVIIRRYVAVSQWFLNLLEVPNPISFMQALTEPFLKIQKFLLTNLSSK